MKQEEKKTYPRGIWKDVVKEDRREKKRNISTKHRNRGDNATIGERRKKWNKKKEEFTEEDYRMTLLKRKEEEYFNEATR